MLLIILRYYPKKSPASHHVEFGAQQFFGISSKNGQAKPTESERPEDGRKSLF